MLPKMEADGKRRRSKTTSGAVGDLASYIEHVAVVVRVFTWWPKRLF